MMISPVTPPHGHVCDSCGYVELCNRDNYSCNQVCPRFNFVLWDFLRACAHPLRRIEFGETETTTSTNTTGPVPADPPAPEGRGFRL